MDNAKNENNEEEAEEEEENEEASNNEEENSTNEEEVKESIVDVDALEASSQILIIKLLSSPNYYVRY